MLELKYTWPHTPNDGLSIDAASTLLLARGRPIWGEQEMPLHIHSHDILLRDMWTQENLAWHQQQPVQADKSSKELQDCTGVRCSRWSQRREPRILINGTISYANHIATTPYQEFKRALFRWSAQSYSLAGRCDTGRAPSSIVMMSPVALI